MVLIAVVFVLAWVGFLILAWLVLNARRGAEARRLEDRLRGCRKPEIGRKEPALIRTGTEVQDKLVLSLLKRVRLMDAFKNLLEQAGLRWDTGRTVQCCLALFLVGFAVVWYLFAGYRSLAPLIGLALASLPLLYIFRARSVRLRRFEEMFAESLEFLSRAMRAGHAFTVSLEMLHTEFQEPIAGEFQRVFEEQNLGLPIDTALQKLARRVPSMDVRFFVSAVLLQKRTGGNLAELLDKLAYLIRERFKLRGRIRAVSAHGRLTGSVLSLVPVGVGLVMFNLNPDYILFFLKDETGKMLLAACVALQLAGYGIIRKIIAIEV